MSNFLDRILNKPNKARIAAWAKDAKPEEVADAIDSLVSEKDCKGNDSRKRFHDALDRLMDSKEQEQGALDADLEELKGMFGGNGGKDETVAGEETGEEQDDDAEALTIEPADRPKSSGAGTDATDAAYRAGALAVLKALRPAIATSGSKSAIGAFDTAARTVQGSKVGTASKGGYGAVATAAQSVGHDAMQQKTAQELANKAIADAEAANKARFNSRN